MAALGSLKPSDMDTVREALEELDREHGDALEIAEIHVEVNGAGNNAVITYAITPEDGPLIGDWDTKTVQL
jgi:hypothetical protein